MKDMKYNQINGMKTKDVKFECDEQVINYQLWKNHYYPPAWNKKLCPSPNFNGSYRQDTNNFPYDRCLSDGINQLFEEKMPQKDFPGFFIQCQACDITGKVRIGSSASD